MPTPEPEVQAAPVEQTTPPNRATRRAKAKEEKKVARATAKSLLSKKPAQREVPIVVDDEQQTLLLQAMSATDWDELIAAHPPTKDQKDRSLSFNPDTFAPAMLSRVVIEPKMSEEDWIEIFTSDAWNRGELNDTYGEAVALCTQGFVIPFNASA